MRFSEGTGLGVPWPGEDFAILVFAALFLMVALIAVALMRRDGAQALP
jgi:Ca2+/H+ antiporter, TMEM165/GDT1 family